MTIKEMLRLLKVLKNLVLVFFIPMLLFYLGIVLPEYLACGQHKNETDIGIDFWGNQVDCCCDNAEFNQYIFLWLSVFLLIVAIALTTIHFIIRRLRKDF